MELWIIILIIFGFLALFVLSRPRVMPPVWYQIMPRVYDRIPTVIRGGMGWGGRGIHRGEREIEMLPR
jgi:hypothetical protein